MKSRTTNGLALSLVLLVFMAGHISAQGNFLYTNNDVAGANSVSGFVINPADGSLTQISGSPFSTRGQGSAGGLFGVSRIVVKGSFLFASNSGTNDVSVFSINTSTGVLTAAPGSPFPTGGQSAGISGGISLASTPDGKVLFAGSAGSQDITAFNIAGNGALSLISPARFQAGGTIDGMTVSLDGTLLFVALFNQKTLAVFRINPYTPPSKSILDSIPPPSGGLTPLGNYPTGNYFPAGPVHFCGTPSVLYGSLSDSNWGVGNVIPILNNKTWNLGTAPGFPVMETGTEGDSLLYDAASRRIFYTEPFGDKVGDAKASYDPIAGRWIVSTLSEISVPSIQLPNGMVTNMSGTTIYVTGYNGSINLFGIGTGGSLTPGPSISTGQGDGLETMATLPPTDCPAPSFNFYEASVAPGGVSTSSTNHISSSVSAGWGTSLLIPTLPKRATGENVASVSNIYGVAVFSLTQGNNVVSETGVPASPPTTSARIFIDFRSGVAPKSGHGEIASINIDTGVAIVNHSHSTANVTYTLHGSTGTILASGAGTVPPLGHRAKFIDQLSDIAPGFVVPANFSTTTQFATLDIASDQPLSILALRLTTNQRGETLITSTPIADLTQTPGSGSLDFPQLADGNGFTTFFTLLNTSGATESGALNIFKNDGTPLVVQQVSGPSASSFHYVIPPGGFYIFQSDGSPLVVHTGSVQVIPDPSSSTPVGAGVFRLKQGGIVVTESGIPSATPTTHARVYVDESGGHDTGIAVASPSGSPVSVTANAFQLDGVTPVGASLGPVVLSGNGHDAKFAGQLISGLPAGFTGVLDLSSASPFVALTLRALTNARGETLFATFPIADFNMAAPSPIVFPQVASGGGFQTEFIEISAGGGATMSLAFFDDSGSPLAIGKSGIR